MQIETIKVGELRTNCYIVTKNNQTIIIDPGDEYEKIKTHCQNKKIVAIFVTHHHFDHVGALKNLEADYNLTHNTSKVWDLEIIPCKGHANDLISLYFPSDSILFSGDFIFYHTIGRCDLLGSDFHEMQKSIQNILNYPENIKIYPGHGIPTTLEEEIPYLKKYL
jgi:glyoxylase-like metal-dependent hydrolase (beta-lactamase superfamily II)